MKFEEKIKQADLLRKESNKAYKELERVVNNWGSELNKSKTPQERVKINKKYSALYSKADKLEDKSYANYYNFVDKQFDRQAVQKCCRGGTFMKKEFINRLSKSNIKKWQEKSVGNNKKTTIKKMIVVIDSGR